MSPQLRRQRTIEELFAFLSDLCAVGPVIILWEDVHWADPSSLEILSQLGGRIGGLPVLALLTSRPDGTLPRLPQDAVRVGLDRLDRRESELMLDRLCNGKPLPAAVRERIVDRTDGVPLFIEELARTVLEIGCSRRPWRCLGADPADRGAAHSRDADGFARRRASIGWVPPRRWRRSRPPSVDNSRSRCSSWRPGASPVPWHRRCARWSTRAWWRPATRLSRLYAFRHALIQDAAYRGMLRSRRRQLHGRIADVLAENFPQRCEVEPESVARHLSFAGRSLEAAGAWRRAGARAASRAAFGEAATHFETGLADARRAAEERERHLIEAELSANLGATLMQSRGFAAAEVETAYRAAHTSCARLGDDAPQMMPVLWGLVVHRTMVGHVRSAGRDRRADAADRRSCRRRGPASAGALHQRWQQLLMPAAGASCWPTWRRSAPSMSWSAIARWRSPSAWICCSRRRCSRRMPVGSWARSSCRDGSSRRATSTSTRSPYRSWRLTCSSGAVRPCSMAATSRGP